MITTAGDLEAIDRLVRQHADYIVHFSLGAIHSPVTAAYEAALDALVNAAIAADDTPGLTAQEWRERIRHRFGIAWRVEVHGGGETHEDP